MEKKRVKLGDVIKVQSGVNLTQQNMTQRGEYPVYGGNGITGAHSEFNVEEPTIVIGRVGYYCGSVHLTSEKAWVTDNAFITKFSPEIIDKRFLYQLLKSLNLRQYSVSSAQPVISGGRIYPVEFSLPSLDEQVRIANTLDTADALRRKDQELLGKYDELAQSVFYEMFGDPRTADNGWNVVKLGSVAKITSGGTPSRSKPEYYSDATVPWVKTGDLKKIFLYEVEEFITEQAVAASAAKVFPAGTVLVALYGATIGACSILKFPAATNQACGAILPCAVLNEDFLYWYFRTIKKDIIALGVGGAQPNISGQILKNLPIALPPLNVQNDFSSRVHNIYKQYEAVRSATAETTHLLTSLLSKYFA